MTVVQVALYARVSSEQQAEAKTIESQLAEVRARIAADGFDLNTVVEFVDDGSSGSTLVRPALERLRDIAVVGGRDRLYVHCPDRFARNYAYQVLPLDELTQRGVDVIFLNRPLGQTPEDQLLLQVQGVIAEYERATFLERSRRGKRHATQEGRVGILCNAPLAKHAALRSVHVCVPRRRPAHSRRGYWGKDAPKDEWITIPVPALIEPAWFEAVQEQLEENRRRARIPEKGNRYLLQGLLVCAKCGYAYHGRTNDARNAYYRCSGSMSLPRFGEQHWCWNKELRMDQTHAAVWLETFVAKVQDGLHQANFQTRRDIIRALVKHLADNRLSYSSMQMLSPSSPACLRTKSFL